MFAIVALITFYIVIGWFSELVFHASEQDEFGPDLPRDMRTSVIRFALWPMAWYFYFKSNF